MDELNMRTNNIDELLGQHIESTQNWQRYTGERIGNLEQQQQQTQEEWRAYYRWAGFNPTAMSLKLAWGRTPMRGTLY